MMKPPCPLHRTLPATLAACILVAACALDPVKEARKQFDEGRPEDALVALEKLTREDPSNHAARSEYHRLRELLAAQWLGQAETLRVAGELEAAEALYQRVRQYDPANARARAGLAQIDTDRRHRAIILTTEKLVRSEKLTEAQDALRPVLTENPQNREAQRLQRRIDERLVKPAITTTPLRATSTKPLSLELHDVSVRSAFDVLARATGISFVFDRDVKAEQHTTILVREATLEEAIKLLLMTNQLEQKILNERTVFVFPNTPAKLREYQELVVRGFYIANADVKQTANMIRTMVKTRDIFVDEKLNLLVIKDTPNAIRLAERLIAAQDLAEAEVVLEVEVLEVASTRLLELGLRWPEQVLFQDPATVPAAGAAGALLNLQRASGPLTAFVATPVLLLKLHQQNGSTSVLANPRIRVKNKEKARVHIGDRVPVITTTAAATGGFVSESVSYLDVGLKLDVEPLIYLEDEVGIKVGLEVSNVVREVRGSNTGTLAYQIGTRNATTTLRLRDGETQILAGLISDEDRRTADGLPGLTSLPILGRLFSTSTDTKNKTEIVLLITPRLMRTLARPEARMLEFAAGTESSTGAAPSAAVVPAPFIPPSVPDMPPPKPPAPGQLQPLTPPGAAPSTAPGPVMVPFGGVQPQ